MKQDPPTIPLNAFEQAKNLIFSAKKILIISHASPDADAIGANLALREVLERLGKNVDSACIDPPPENCLFLPKAESFIQKIQPHDYDLLISVDCGGHKVLGFHKEHPEILDRNKTTLINFDHHPSNDHFGSVNIVMDETPSTCFILYLFFGYCSWEISPSMATAMLHGLYYDTGSFMHSNTDATTLRVAGRLKSLGGTHEICVKKLFHSTTLNQLKLWGRVLSRMHFNEKNAVVSAIRSEDYLATGCKFEDLSGLINYLNQVPEAKFTMLLTEDMKGNIKGSLRTQNDDINLSKIAGLFGGGGHKKAAGFTIPGKLQTRTQWKVI
ncbi:MAG: phosphoesterase RecJ-like protein [Oceanicoccus sp.]|jgi:phosphoesterase RecJ-like protein